MKCYNKDYPRPQFVRKQWENLNGTWDFRFDDQNVGEREKWYKNFKRELDITQGALRKSGVPANRVRKLRKEAEKNNIKIVEALALPGKVAPTTTAKFMKEIVYELI